MPRLIITLISLFALSTFSVQAQVKKLGFPLRVSTNVDGDENIKSEVLSRINSGLRALGDIVIVDDDPKLQISIVVVANTAVSGRELGYTFSIVVTRAFQRSDLAVLKAWAKSEAAEQVLADYFGNGVSVVHHSIITGGELQDICKRTVSSIDVGPIEYERKYWQEIEDNSKRIVELKKKYPEKSLIDLQEMVDREKKRKPNER